MVYHPGCPKIGLPSGYNLLCLISNSARNNSNVENERTLAADWI